jgi:hypothetical protein
MTIPSVHCEARLKGIAKRHDKGGDWAQITLQVQPEDLPNELWQAPLGTIFMVAFARVGDNGRPVEQETKKATLKRPGQPFSKMPRSQQAGILCKDIIFQKWVRKEGQPFRYSESPDGARSFVLNECHIRSRRELNASDSAAEKWDNLVRQFMNVTGRAPEARG